MTVDHELQKRHLVVGDETKNVPVGSRIVGGDPSAVRLTVERVDEETGALTVQMKDLIGGGTKEAPMLLGTDVTIVESR